LETYMMCMGHYDIKPSLYEKFIKP
jgi:hypothetical protein